MKTLRIPFEAHTLTVYQSGGGPRALLLLHGGGVDSALLSWREVMVLLPDCYTVYAPDLLGYGASDRPEGMQGEGFYAAHIASVQAIVDALGLSRFALAGLSMGGAIAIGYTLSHPEHVEALLALDSWGLVSRMPPQGLYYWMVNTSMLRGSFRLFAKHPALVRWTLEAALFGQRAAVTDALVAEVLALCRAPHAEASMRDFQRSSLTRHGTRPDYTARLGELSLPVLFVNGARDALVKPRDVRRAAAAVPGAQLRLMEGCRHWPQKECPALFARIADEFLSAALSASGGREASPASQA